MSSECSFHFIFSNKTLYKFLILPLRNCYLFGLSHFKLLCDLIFVLKGSHCSLNQHSNFLQHSDISSSQVHSFSRPFCFHTPLKRAVGYASQIFQTTCKIVLPKIGAFVSLRCIIVSCTSQKLLVTCPVPFEAALPASVCTNYQHQIRADILRGTWFIPWKNNSYCARCAVIRRLEDAFETSFHIRHSLSHYLTLHNWQFKMMSSNKYEVTKAVRRNIIRHYKLTKQTIRLFGTAVFQIQPGHQLSRIHSLEEHSDIIPRLGHDHFLAISFLVLRPPVVLTLHVHLSEL